MVKDDLIALAFQGSPSVSEHTGHTISISGVYYHVDERPSVILWGIQGAAPSLSVFAAEFEGAKERRYSSFNDGYLTTAHQHDYIELLYVVQGCFSQNIAGKDYRFYENDIVFINHGVLHGDYLRAQDACVLFLNIPDALFEQLFKNSDLQYKNFVANLLLEHRTDYSHIHGTLKHQNAAEGETYTASSLNEIVREILRSAPGSAYIIKGHLIRLISALVLEYKFDLLDYSRNDMRRLLYEEIVEDIRQNPATTTIEKLQNKYYFNRDFFNRLIKEQSGYTFRELRQSIRIEEAKRLLTQTDDRVEDIALAVGYENLGFFYRIFVAKCGKLPREYRLSER